MAEAAETDPRERSWSLAAAVILSLATLVSAWCGYQASVWNGVVSTQTREANAARLDSARHADVADRQLSSDLLIFAVWLEAEVTGAEQVADSVAERFLPHFRPAFEAWRAQPPAPGSLLPSGTPFERTEYVLPTQAAADAAQQRAEAAVVAADAAGTWSSRYVLATVLFASVLFLAGIAAKLSPRAAHLVVVLAGLTLVGAVASLVSVPALLDGL